MENVVVIIGDVVLLAAIKEAVSELDDIKIKYVLREKIDLENMGSVLRNIEKNSIDLLIVESNLIQDVDFYKMCKKNILLIGSKPVGERNITNINYKGGLLGDIKDVSELIKKRISGSAMGWNPEHIIKNIMENKNYKKSYEDEIVRQNRSDKISIAMLPVSSRVKKKDSVGMIVIGSSIGGTSVLEEILSGLSGAKVFPPIVITQHMSKGFLGGMIKRMSEKIKWLSINVAASGMELKDNSVYFAADGKHMTFVVKMEKIYIQFMKVNEDIGGHLPSIEAMYSSADSVLGGDKVLSIILTGMGSDGVEGMGRLHNGGSNTSAQDRNSCVVFGIAGECVKRGYIDNELTVKQIINKINSVC